MLAHQLVRLSESHEMVRLRRVMFILDAPLVPVHKLYLSLCITESVSTGTFWSTIWSTIKNVPVMERPYKCIHNISYPWMSHLGCVRSYSCSATQMWS